MLSNPIFIWFVVGVLFLLADKATGRFGFIYASYASFTISLFVLTGIMGGDGSTPYIIAQVIFFFLASTIFWYLLREDPKKKNKEDEEFYKNIIGQTVEVGEDGLNAISGGEVKCEGRVMPARLGGSADGEIVEAGTKVVVQEIVSDTLIVTIKK